MYICLCKRVTCSQIRSAVEGGDACSLRDVSQQLGVGTQCGKCGKCARNLIEEALTAPIADQAQPQFA